jgi:peptidoglycan hydrolase CwlO-like protein
LAIVALLGGFYYTTQYRLQSLEAKVDEIGNKIQQMSRRLTQIKKQIKNN